MFYLNIYFLQLSAHPKTFLSGEAQQNYHIASSYDYEKNYPHMSAFWVHQDSANTKT